MYFVLPECSNLIVNPQEDVPVSQAVVVQHEGVGGGHGGVGQELGKRDTAIRIHQSFNQNERIYFERL